jgi:hypothetical protein
MRSWAAHRVALAAVVAFGLCVSFAAQPAAQNPTASVCDIRTSERVVAVGDVHGAYDQFVTILRAARVIDGRERWIGGRAHLVQTGDVLDRGPESRKVVDLLRRLERDATRAGGRVHALLGNHEFMRIVGDWRYVSARELAAFTSADSADLRDRVLQTASAQAASRARAEKRDFNEREYRAQFIKEIPLGYLEMRVAFDSGDYGRWVRSRVAAVKINGVLFIHGGVSEKVSALGCEGLNAAIRTDMASLPVPAEKVMSLLASTEDGPLWYRGLAAEPEETFAPIVAGILERLGATAVVVGHTPTLPDARIQVRHGGRVVLIDTGMLGGEFYPGGRPSAFEMHGDAWTAIYETGREPLHRK